MTVSLNSRICAGGASLLALAALGGGVARAQAPGDPPPPAATTPVTPPATDTTPTAPPAPATPPATTPPPASTTGGNDPASSTPRKRARFRIGPEVGVYLPTSSKARDQFGSSWLTIGLGIGSIGRVRKEGQTSFDLQVLYQSRSGNHAFLAPVGVGYRVALSQSGGATTYAGATADVYFADIRSGDYDVHSGVRTGFGGSPLIGVTFGDSGFLEARYLIVSKIRGFDLSGLNLTAGYRF